MTEAISATAIFDAMGTVLTRWTMGLAGAPAASFWRNELGDDPAEAELRLLGLSGQFLSAAVTMEPATTLRMLPDIPTLELPTTPETLRPLVRRLVTTKKQAEFGEVAHFLAERGWSLHPADWMPAAGDDDVPEIYAPWRDWAAAIAEPGGPKRQQANGGLSAETWDDFWPAARKAALAALRRRDPSEARKLLAAKLSSETADTRLRLLSLMSERLSPDDITFLESIAADDRAPKVKALATSLLGRLGRGSATGEDVAELAGFFSVKNKGVLQRSRVIEAHPLKTPAQAQRRKALFERTDLSAFSGAFGLAPPELIDGWAWNVDHAADTTLLDMIVSTGTDTDLTQAAQAVSQSDAAGLIAALTPRLAPAERARHAKTALHTRGISFEAARQLAGPAARLDDLLSAPAGISLLAALQREDAKPSDYISELHAVGLIASRDEAQRSLQRLTAAGLLQGDPRLDMLRLNAALDDKGAKP